MDILHTYLYCYNEEKLLPYVLNHYNTIFMIMVVQIVVMKFIRDMIK